MSENGIDIIDKLKKTFNSKKKLMNLDETTFRANEMELCRNNPLYFIYNYVFIRETGSSLKITSKNLHPKMKRVIRAVYRYHGAILMASRQLGKALALDTKIPLFSGGFKEMKDIEVGDVIFNDKRQPTTVLKTTNILYDRECYELTFQNTVDDSIEKITADANHRWALRNNYSYEYRIFRSEELFSGFKNHNFSIQNFKLINIQKTNSVPVKCIQVSDRNGMFLCSESFIPTHNSTISACLLAWALVFFPDNRAIILNMKQSAAKNNLRTIQFIVEHLPSWMVTEEPFKFKGVQSYLLLFNGSRVEAVFPSTVADPSTLARSLTVPILYFD